MYIYICFQGGDAGHTAKAAAAEQKQQAETKEGSTDDRPQCNSNDNVLPFYPSLKLENRELDVPPWPPSFQQKRRLSSGHRRPNINVTPCVGSDGRPIDRDDWSSEKEEFVDDYKRYYAHHKASPLSELEFVDTRKPITQATDAVEGDMGTGVMVEETVDQALARAEEMFRTRAMLGDPSLPHSKVLRRMLRQNCDSSVDA